ncbi:MAG: SIMPL domain-containing protein [Patescibacteria group bacterium]
MNDFFNFKEMYSGEIEQKKKGLIKWATILMMVGAVFVAAEAVNTVKEYRYIGAGVQATNTISVSGEGEVFAVPDIATVSFSVTNQGKTVADTQKEVSKKINAALAFLKDSGIADKDVKTTNYSAYPRYEYNAWPCSSGSVDCLRPGKQTLVGYDVTQTISVKVRDTDKTGAVLEGLAKAGITEISGPDFSIDDDNTIKAEARKKAIDDAKEKAKVLAKDLRVKLVRIVGFSESGNYPIYYAKGMALGMGGGPESVPAPDLPKGENKVTSTVTITYEIR